MEDQTRDLAERSQPMACDVYNMQDSLPKRYFDSLNWWRFVINGLKWVQNPWFITPKNLPSFYHFTEDTKSHRAPIVWLENWIERSTFVLEFCGEFVAVGTF